MRLQTPRRKSTRLNRKRFFIRTVKFRRCTGTYVLHHVLMSIRPSSRARTERLRLPETTRTRLFPEGNACFSHKHTAPNDRNRIAFKISTKNSSSCART